ncbi:unnamed protein product [Urochloa decumbens]|uniref:KIB1-4 beta-propeller domain-containing protein n=1 Tax=Urochloa decumbens TaxID=240449 RepID=A0ABC9FQW0_9POAL
MMLPEGHCLHPGHPDLRGHARFLNLDTGALVRAAVPLLDEDHLAVDSVDGLLLLLGDQYQRGTVRLLNPLTGDVAELPPLATLLPLLADTSLYSCPVLYRIKRLGTGACASASFKDGVVTVMLALDAVNRVAFATSLDRQWSLSSWKYWTAAPPLAFQGKLYMLETTPDYECGNNVHKFLQVGPPVYQDEAASGGVLQPPEVIATITGSKFCDPDYLVECDSEILVLGYRGASMSQIVICKLADLVQQRFIPMRSIGDNTLFVGKRCISVSSKVLSTVTGDNVVCTHPRKSYLAQYHLSSGTWSPAIDDCSLCGRAQGPSSLVHYVVSCCTRTLWNRGIVLRKGPPGSYAW